MQSERHVEEQLAKLSMDDASRVQSGCYVCSPVFLKPVLVPLTHLDYQVTIAGSIARIRLEQHYHNPVDALLELEYVLPIEPDACVTSFHAFFDDHEVVGMVREKEAARQQYQTALKEGKHVAYGEFNERSKDIMNFRIGNLKPEGRARIVVEFLQPLEVSVNTFWRLCVQSHVWPRYINNGGKPLGKEKANFTWTFKVEISTNKRNIHWTSPSHRLQEISKSATSVMLVLPQSEKPIGDFVLLYTTNNFEEPGLLYGKTDAGACCLFSFIPQFSGLQLIDAERMALKGQDYEPEVSSAVGEFIFLLDRSGSMDGVRINKAKEALAYFLRSLPPDSYFNVWSFGSDYKPVFENSQKYSEYSLRHALQIIYGFKADMGGTEIGGPLTQIFTTDPIKNHPRQLFLLTDGEVADTNQIVNLIGLNSKLCRVHGIGIGQGVSKALLKGCAEKGRGRAVFIADHENVAGKVIELLQTALSPTIIDFTFEFDSNVVEAVIPNPKEMPCILKNEPVNLFVLLKRTFTGKASFSLSYKDSVTIQTHRSKIQFDEKAVAGHPFLEKMATHRKLTVLCDAIRSGGAVSDDALLEEVGDLRKYAIAESVRSQVLCELTAFICVGKQLADNTLQEYQSRRLKLEASDPIQGQTKRSVMFRGSATIGVKPGKHGSAKPMPIPKQQAKFPEELFDAIESRKACIKSFSKQQETNLLTDWNEPICYRPRGVQIGEITPTQGYNLSRKLQQESNIGQLQKFDGSWDSKSMAAIKQCFRLTDMKINLLLTELEGNLELLLTVLAVLHLESLKDAPENALLIKKGREWIRKESAKKGITADQLASITAML